MAFDNPFEAPGLWLKGNLHTHTTLSDGVVSPQERAAAYEARGYDFLAFTDHGCLADLAGIVVDRLLLIRGIELVGANPVGGPPHHIVGLDLPAGFLAPEAPDVQAVVDAIAAAGGAALIAHPYWCGQNIRDLEIVRGALGLEVFNTTCLRGIGKGTSSVHWDDLLTLGRRLLGFAVDDVHHATKDAYGGWIVAKCAERTVRGVMDAIRRGCFYATCGPTFESLEVDEGRVRVRTSPVAHISFICDGPRGGHVFREDGGPVTEGEFVLNGPERFLRVECADGAGRAAWTNPVLFA